MSRTALAAALQYVLETAQASRAAEDTSRELLLELRETGLPPGDVALACAYLTAALQAYLRDYAKPGEGQLACTLCHRKDVRMLIGASTANVCDACVAMCWGIVEEESGAQGRLSIFEGRGSP